MIIESRITAERVDDLVALLHILTDDETKQRINASARHDVLSLQAVMGCNGVAQRIIFRIAIFPHFGCFIPHGLDDRRRWTKAAFIGADPRLEGLTAL
ncbi:Uncharacterised protein [Brucella suis]|nr:Uncharacterised protein [Brucella suis]